MRLWLRDLKSTIKRSPSFLKTLFYFTIFLILFTVSYILLTADSYNYLGIHNPIYKITNLNPSDFHKKVHKSIEENEEDILFCEEEIILTNIEDHHTKIFCPN